MKKNYTTHSLDKIRIVVSDDYNEEFGVYIFPRTGGYKFQGLRVASSKEEFRALWALVSAIASDIDVKHPETITVDTTCEQKLKPKNKNEPFNRFSDIDVV